MNLIDWFGKLIEAAPNGYAGVFKTKESLFTTDGFSIFFKRLYNDPAIDPEIGLPQNTDDKKRKSVITQMEKMKTLVVVMPIDRDKLLLALEGMTNNHIVLGIHPVRTKNSSGKWVNCWGISLSDEDTGAFIMGLGGEYRQDFDWLPWVDDDGFLLNVEER